MEGGAISAELEVEGQQTFSREGVTPWTVVTQKKKKKRYLVKEKKPCTVKQRCSSPTIYYMTGQLGPRLSECWLEESFAEFEGKVK